jgi:hypothetical protein
MATYGGPGSMPNGAEQKMRPNFKESSECYGVVVSGADLKNFSVSV